jgi:hypothetical protein
MSQPAAGPRTDRRGRIARRGEHLNFSRRAGRCVRPDPGRALSILRSTAPAVAPLLRTSPGRYEAVPRTCKGCDGIRELVAASCRLKGSCECQAARRPGPRARQRRAPTLAPAVRPSWSWRLRARLCIRAGPRRLPRRERQVRFGDAPRWRTCSDGPRAGGRLYRLRASLRRPRCCRPSPSRVSWLARRRSRQARGPAHDGGRGRAAGRRKSGTHVSMARDPPDGRDPPARQLVVGHHPGCGGMLRSSSPKAAQSASSARVTPRSAPASTSEG